MSDLSESHNRHLRVVKGRCTGCQICLLACSFHHTGLFRPSLARLRVEITRIIMTPILPEVFDFPVVCLQCKPAPCAEACPEGAILKDETGLVKVVQGKCMGCGLCVPACPQGVMGLDMETGKAYKCDLCGGTPECATLCPAGAIIFKTEHVGS